MAVAQVWIELFFILATALSAVSWHARGPSLAGGNWQGSLKMIYKPIVAALKLGQLVSWASSVQYFRPGPDVTVQDWLWAFQM